MGGRLLTPCCSCKSQTCYANRAKGLPNPSTANPPVPGMQGCARSHKVCRPRLSWHLSTPRPTSLQVRPAVRTAPATPPACSQKQNSQSGQSVPLLHAHTKERGRAGRRKQRLESTKHFHSAEVPSDVCCCYCQVVRNVNRVLCAMRPNPACVVSESWHRLFHLCHLYTE